jgi:hypothetical protein
MLMGPDHRVVYAHLPLYIPNGVAPGLSVRQEAIPGAVAPPAVEAIEAGLPGAIPFRKVASGRAGAQLPEDTVDDGAVVSPLASALAVLGQERLDLSPGTIGDLSASDHDVLSRSRTLLRLRDNTDAGLPSDMP